jgi:uncharacterized protein
MLTEPLPTTLDVRKAAAREVSVSGVVALSNLDRIQGALASNVGQVEVTCDFRRDQQYRCLVAISLKCSVAVNCQRCLEPMTVDIDCSNVLALVKDDEQARQLPARLDPLLEDGGPCNLWTLVEDELMLSLPIVSYHESEVCKLNLDDYSAPVEVEADEESNPFKVLEQLKKPGSNT